MQTIIVNVGLNVKDTEPQYQLDNTILTLISCFDLIDVRVRKDGEYLENSERTVVAKLRTKKDLSLVSVQELLSNVAENLEQECIAFQYEGAEGMLAYSTSFEGERMLFDEKYFKDFSEKSLEVPK